MNDTGLCATERKNIDMDRCEKYRAYMTKDHLMGPSSFRLLDELLQRGPADACRGRVLDLGCGNALTSIFAANETGAKAVYAFDLWCAAADNLARVREAGLEDRVIPIHGDAMEMPFAEDWFDTVISVDAYHYFGCGKGVFSQKVLPFVKRGGNVMIAVPGLKKEPEGEIRTLFEAWAEGEDALTFKTAGWWQKLLTEECKDLCDITVTEAECCDLAWREWFDTGHEFALRDREYLSRGLYELMTFVFMYIRKR